MADTESKRSWWRYYAIYLGIMACLYPAWWWGVYKPLHAWAWVFWGLAILAGMTGAARIERRFRRG